MLMPVLCTHCKKSGTFAVEMKFTHHLKLCGGCSGIEQRTWTFNFCDADCLKEWMLRNMTAQFGFPCQDCLCLETGIPTGWASGIKENGKCLTCEGERKVRGCTKTGWKT